MTWFRRLSGITICSKIECWLGSGMWMSTRASNSRGLRFPRRGCRRREQEPQGPTNLYYYDHLAATLGPDVPSVALDELAQFEVLNFTDGRRTVAEIRDAVSAELDPVSIEAVTEYLEILARAGVVRFRE